MNTKYELTDETIEHRGRILHRIRALKDISAIGFDIQAGMLGGFVESEFNLSYEEGDCCWIYDDAKVYDQARVQDWAQVIGVAEVYDRVIIKDFATVGGDARVGGKRVIKNSDQIIGDNPYKKPGSVFRMINNGELQ